MSNREMKVIVGALLSLSIANAWAEEGSNHHHHMPESGQVMEMPEMEMAPGMEHEISHADHGESQQQAPSTGLRDPHAWSDGYGFGPIPRPHLADEHPMGGILVERFESVHEDRNNSAAYELRGWYGRDFDRVVIKAEGDVDGGEIEEATTELLWSHAIAPFWNGELGLRHDSGNVPDRSWLAIGIEGISPYWFEIGASAYLGSNGRSAVTLSAEYELLLTQRLILQPRLEANLYGKRDSERRVDSGLSDAVAGVRLRYEIRREFAPYVGIEWAGKFGGTADMERNAGAETSRQHLVAGVRFWF